MRSSASAMVTVTFGTTRDGDLHVDLHLPTGRVDPPVVMWLHGGGLIGGSRLDLDAAQAARYLDAGIAVAAIEYRLAPATQLRDIASDVHTAHRWLLDAGRHHGLDPERVGIVGHSAGGYLALLCGARMDPLPRAIVTFYGYGDIAGDWYGRPSAAYQFGIPEAAARAAIRDGAEDRMLFYRWCRQEGRWLDEVVGDGRSAYPSAPDDFRPIAMTRPDHPPTMLLHGTNDTDVPVEQAIAMAAALDAAGVEQDLVLLPGLGHGFDADVTDPTVSSAFDRAIRFLSRHLRP